MDRVRHLRCAGHRGKLYTSVARLYCMAEAHGGQNNISQHLDVSFTPLLNTSPSVDMLHPNNSKVAIVEEVCLMGTIN